MIKPYRVIKFTINKPPKTIYSGLSLEEAQEICGREDTHGEGWFYGYDLVKGVTEDDS